MSVKLSEEVCPMCGGMVAFHEDSIMLRALAAHDPEMVMCKGSRHIHCDTSIGQYVCHPSFPSIFENRKQYDKRQGNPLAVCIREEVITEAWVVLQVKCGMSLNTYEGTVYE